MSSTKYAKVLTLEIKREELTSGVSLFYCNLFLLLFYFLYCSFFIVIVVSFAGVFCCFIS